MSINRFATATLATPATRREEWAVKVAKVATVAVANALPDENQHMLGVKP